MLDQLFYLISAALLGLVIGALIMYFVSVKGKNSAKNITAVEKKLNNYQQDVVQHFEQTADLIDDLTQSYKKVFDHLGNSARQLLTDDQVQEQIEKRKNKQVTLGFLTEEGAELVSNDKDTEASEPTNSKSTESKEQAEKEVDDENNKETKESDKEIENLVEEIEVEMDKQEGE